MSKWPRLRRKETGSLIGAQWFRPMLRVWCSDSHPKHCHRKRKECEEIYPINAQLINVEALLITLVATNYPHFLLIAGPFLLMDLKLLNLVCFRVAVPSRLRAILHHGRIEAIPHWPYVSAYLVSSDLKPVTKPQWKREFRCRYGT